MVNNKKFAISLSNSTDESFRWEVMVFRNDRQMRRGYLRRVGKRCPVGSEAIVLPVKDTAYPTCLGILLLSEEHLGIDVLVNESVCLALLLVKRLVLLGRFNDCHNIDRGEWVKWEETLSGAAGRIAKLLIESTKQLLERRIDDFIAEQMAQRYPKQDYDPGLLNKLTKAEDHQRDL